MPRTRVLPMQGPLWERMKHSRPTSSVSMRTQISTPLVALKEAERLQKQIGQKDSLVGQLQEEVASKDAEILYLKRQNEDRDAATANDRAVEISEKAEQKLARTVAYARLQARRQAFEEASTEGVDLSAEIEKAKTLEEESAPSTTSDEDSRSDSDGSEEFLPFPEKWNFTCKWYTCAFIILFVVEADSVKMFSSLLYSNPVAAIRGPRPSGLDRKLEAYSIYDEHKWRDLSKGIWEAKHHGIGEFFEMRSCPLKDEEGSPASKPKKDNKRKESSKDKGAHSEASPVRRSKEDVSAEPARKTEDLECLWGEVGQAKCECNELKAQIDAHIAAKKNALAKASSLRVQLRNARENSTVQTSRIARLESDLLKMKAEVGDARVEAEEIRAKVYKKVAVYLKDDATLELS
ncbi:uncharacterized protein [Nicotiana sylvestris]|uniref:uncharacterized protein n=1 Tax=Nicotiana sylvestris TaxID=4096 RepID=UPI00388CD310